MSRIRVSSAAAADLDDIWLYAAEQRSEDVADRLIDSIVGRFAVLARMPRLGRRRPEIIPGLRSFPVGNYVIYYTAHKSRVVILRVLHGARDVGQLLSPPATGGPS
jgi:toxin ParE1/3/4